MHIDGSGGRRPPFFPNINADTRFAHFSQFINLQLFKILILNVGLSSSTTQNVTQHISYLIAFGTFMGSNEDMCSDLISPKTFSISIQKQHALLGELRDSWALDRPMQVLGRRLFSVSFFSFLIF